jgi:hypothetical protein
MVSLGSGVCFVQIAVMDVPVRKTLLERGFLMIAPMARITFAAFAADGCMAGDRSRAGRSRHRDLHRRKDHGAAHLLPAEQCRLPAEDDQQADIRPSAEDRCQPTARSRR